MLTSFRLDKTANFEHNVLWFANFDIFLDFNDVNIKIKKNEALYIQMFLQGI